MAKEMKGDPTEVKLEIQGEVVVTVEVVVFDQGEEKGVGRGEDVEKEEEIEGELMVVEVGIQSEAARFSSQLFFFQSRVCVFV